MNMDNQMYMVRHQVGPTSKCAVQIPLRVQIYTYWIIFIIEEGFSLTTIFTLNYAVGGTRESLRTQFLT